MSRAIHRRGLIGAGIALAAGSAARAEDFRIRLATRIGDIDLELSDRAQMTVRNFLRHIADGEYRRASFYRTVRPAGDSNAIPIEVIQGGPRNPEAPFKGIPVETTLKTGLTHKAGTISMARMAPGWRTPLATTEFFICLGDSPGLDFGGARNPDGQGFAAFGQVTSGMEVVRAIHAMPTGDDMEGTTWAGQILTHPVIFNARRL